MPKTKFQDIVFTTIMASGMVYGMVLYNIILATERISTNTFTAALHELPLMVAIAFIFEFFLIGGIAKKIAFSLIKPEKHSQLITPAISFCICMLMCPTMSLIATVLFKEPSLSLWLKAWGYNLPIAVLYQLLLCGPVVRFLFRLIFERGQKNSFATIGD